MKLKDLTTKTTKIISDAVNNLYNVIKFCESLKRWCYVIIVYIMKFFITKKYNLSFVTKKTELFSVYPSGPGTFSLNDNVKVYNLILLVE